MANQTSERLVEKAISASKAGDKPAAREILSQVVREEPENARAWYLLSQVVEEPAQAISCLEKALSLAPDNERVKQRLESLRAGQGHVEPLAAQFRSGPAAIPAARALPKERRSRAPKRVSIPGRMVVWIIIACLVLVAGGVGLYALFARGFLNIGSQGGIPPTVSPPAAILPTTAAVPPAASPAITQLAAPITADTPVPSMTATPTLMARIGPLACIPDNERIVTLVSKALDGDTIEVVINNETYQVRYIGIEAPQTLDIIGAQAHTINRNLVEGQRVTLIRDVTDVDAEGRLWRYVLVENTFVNYELVRQGYARAKDIPPDTACAAMFALAEQEAKLDWLGFWALTVTPPALPPVLK
jgi:endonuclease YncB( thermonuclease family)